jgi:histone acetyltransferase (RNA polymerase elongator complex component)
MATNTTRWNLVVSKQTDRDLRQLLANYSEDGGKKGSLSRFVEDAVKKQIFETTAQRIKERNINVPFAEIEAAVEESLAWARAQR